MTARLTDDQLRELLELEAKATPGSWNRHPRLPQTIEALGRSVAVCVTLPSGVFKTGEQDANTALISAARNAIRPLVEELLEARKLLRNVLDCCDVDEVDEIQPHEIRAFFGLLP